MSNDRLFLRIGVVVLFATLTLSIVTSFFAQDLLPDVLRNWDGKAGEQPTFLSMLGFLLWLLGVVVYVVGLTGLFFCQRWGAVIVLLLTAVFSFVPLLGPTVEPGLASFIANLDSLVTGAVLALAFFTDALSDRPDEQG